MHIEFTELIGKALSSAENINNEEVVFTTTDGEIYKLFHEQSCCEEVIVENVTGDMNDLIGSQIIAAEETAIDSTHRHYQLETANGIVVIEWYGSVSDNSSELVSFIKKT